MGYKIVYRTQKCPTKKVEIFSHKQNPTTKQGPFQTYTGGAPLSIYPTSKGAHWGKKQILDAILIANKLWMRICPQGRRELVSKEVFKKTHDQG